MKTKTRSIRQRVIMGMLLLCGLLCGVSIYAYSAQYQQRQRADQALLHESEILMRLVSINPQPLKPAIDEYIATESRLPALKYVLTLPAQQLSNYQAVGALFSDFKIANLSADQSLYTLELDEDDYRCISVAQSERGRLTLLISLHEFEGIEVLQNLGAASAIAFFVMLALLPLILHWVFMPLNRFSTDLCEVIEPQINRHNFEPIAPQKYARELTPFVSTLNELFGRISSVMQQQRQFTADASHELKTPIAVLKSSLELAQLKPRDGVYYEKLVQDCLTQTNRLESLTYQLLDAARLDVAYKPAEEPVQLDRLILEQLAHCKLLAQAHQKRFEHQLDEQMIHGDAARLKQVVRNILENAIKYAPAQSVIRLTLTARTLSIHDEGGEIPAAAIPHLFDRFYRVDTARVRQAGGTGLGLAIVKSILDQMNAAIVIKSNPGDGTTVTVEF